MVSNMKKKKTVSPTSAILESTFFLVGQSIKFSIKTVRVAYKLLKKPFIAGFVATTALLSAYQNVSEKPVAIEPSELAGPAVLSKSILSQQTYEEDNRIDIDRSNFGIQEYTPVKVSTGSIDTTNMPKLSLGTTGVVLLSPAASTDTPRIEIEDGEDEIGPMIISGEDSENNVILTPVMPPPPAPQASNAPPSLNKSGSSFDCRAFDTFKIEFPGVPEESLKGAMCASTIYGIPASSILAIMKNECNFGQSNANDPRHIDKKCTDYGTKNGCSAAGPGQFIPKTGDNRNKNGKCNRKAGEIYPGDFGELKNPPKEAGVPGYFTNCNGDQDEVEFNLNVEGAVNPWNRLDAACSTANYLSTIFKDVGDWNRTFRIYNGGYKGDASRTAPYAERVENSAAEYDQLFIEKILEMAAPQAASNPDISIVR